MLKVLFTRYITHVPLGPNAGTEFHIVVDSAPGLVMDHSLWTDYLHPLRMVVHVLL